MGDASGLRPLVAAPAAHHARSGGADRCQHALVTLHSIRWDIAHEGFAQGRRDRALGAGLEGALRESVHAIETKLKELNEPQLGALRGAEAA